MSKTLTSLLIGLFAAGSALACSSAGSGGNNVAGGGGVSANGGSGNFGGFGNGSGNGGGGGIIIDAGGTKDSGLTPDSGCATTQQNADQIPLNIFIALDVSGSMVNAGHWPNVKPGLIEFFGDPQSAGLKIALSYFPKKSPLTCDPNDYTVPEVPLGPLTSDPAPADTQEQALINSLNANTPVSGQYTPMYGGLGGALQAAQAFMNSNPGQKAAVILVTDGIPEASYCSTFQLAISNIANLASTAFNGTPSVPTFCLGLQGSKEADLQTIAQAGGGAAFFLGSGTNAKQLLIDKLKSISGSLLACEYSMPKGDPGQPVDPTKVNITYTPGAGGSQQFYKVSGASACVPGGWYYDNDANPTKIILCPATCDQVQQDPNGGIQIVLGCASIPPQ
ncbi:MAG: VWA domain-containing protein [Myxococcales bacterium]|nr:VWA domain-containing protein [Myxococcales bacterium]MCB9577173.1 VWA domain-containing protein [Polyangiaceae bacterium]